MGAIPEGLTPRHLIKWVATDPSMAAAACIAFTHPQVASSVARWEASTRERKPGRSGSDTRRGVVRQACALANRDGAITGSSLYICLLPAMASMYFHQVRMVLQIASTFGLDPSNPLRAAEFLVIRGRYRTVDEAVAALVQLSGSNARRRRSRLANSWRLAGRVPEVLGLRLDKLTRPKKSSVFVGVLQASSLVLPFVGIPIWAGLAAHSTRRLAVQATTFYESLPHETSPRPPIQLAARTKTSTKWMRASIVALLAVALGVGSLSIPALVPYGHLYLVLLTETVLFLTFGRLLWITRAQIGAKIGT